MGVLKKCLLVAFYTLIVIVGGATSVAGQTFYLFHHLTTENGLFNSNVKTILKDRKGFLWVGTESGLNRYDGYEFKTYTRKEGDPNSLETNDVSEILEDGMGNLWLRGYSYILYNREKDHFITDPSEYLKGLGIETDGPFKVHVDKNKDLWIFDETSASFYDIRSGEIKTFKLNTRLLKGFQFLKKNFLDKGIPILMGEYGAYRRGGSNYIPKDLETHNASVDYWITFVTKQAVDMGIAPFFWDTGGALDRSNLTVKDQRTIDAILAGGQ